MKQSDPLDSLSPSDRRSLIIDAGLARLLAKKPGIPCSLEEIAQETGVSRERVRQIQDHGLRKLRMNDKAMRVLYDMNKTFHEKR